MRQEVVRVHSVSRAIAPVLISMVGLIRFRVGSLGHLLMSSCSLGFAWFRSGSPRGSQVHSGSYGFTSARLGVGEFIRVRVGTLVRA